MNCHGESTWLNQALESWGWKGTMKSEKKAVLNLLLSASSYFKADKVG